MNKIEELKGLLSKATPGPLNCATGKWGEGRVNKWSAREHLYVGPPYEGDLNNEWGLYPPLGESGPVALVAGRDNAHLFEALRNLAPQLLAVVIAADAIDKMYHTSASLYFQDATAKEAQAHRDDLMYVLRTTLATLKESAS